MRKIFLISHGKLSEGMAHSAQMIAGEKDTLSYAGLMPGGNVTEMINEIEKVVQAETDNQFLIISDVFGGSVCNEAMRLAVYENVKLATGMNLLAVVQLLFADEKISDEEFAAMIEGSKETVRVIGKPEVQDDDDDEFF